MMFPFPSISSKCCSFPNFRIRTIFTSTYTFLSYFSSTILSKLSSISFFNVNLISFLK
nr:MAG TPA: hypothetical protein [Caudoviricetes sp.]